MIDQPPFAAAVRGPAARHTHRRPLRCLSTLGAALLALAGCKDEKKVTVDPAGPAAGVVLTATQTDLRAATGAKAQFRGLQTYQQAMPDRVAVCGQVTPFPDSPGTFVPFVSIVTVPAKGDRLGHATFDHRVATSTAEASRVYLAIVAFCWDRGGPGTGPSQSVASLPPLPDALPDGRDAAQPAVATRPPEPIAAGTATMRQAANLHGEPHGPSLRVLAKGTTMHVFGQAPGGWYQVGDNAPWGWVHESMLDRH